LRTGNLKHGTWSNFLVKILKHTFCADSMSTRQTFYVFLLKFFVINTTHY
jgi:hypothetical protein